MSSELPSYWALVTIGSVTRVKRGASPRPIQDPKWFSDEGHGWVRISDVTASDRVLRQTTQYLSDAGRAASVEIVPGDLIMSICGTIGRPLFSGIHACIHDGFVAFREIDKARLEPDYLYFFLQAQTRHFEAQSQPGTQRNLNSSLVGTTEIPLPPLDEQRRIAEVLRSVDEAIAAAENASKQARYAFDGLLFDYFSDGGAHTSLPNFTPLSDLIVLQSGFAFKSEEYQDHGHFLMRISNVQDGQISLENPKFVRLDNKTQAFELQEGDILTSLTGNIGRVARITVEHLPAALNQRVARIKPKPGAPIDADYLFFSLKSPLLKSGLAGESGGAAQQNVSPKAIGKIEIPLPPMTDQKRIGEMLSAVEDTRVRCDYALEHLRTVKTSLMSDLLSGRVRVPA
jgi:type I restriction enzyme, S subunit